MCIRDRYIDGLKARLAEVGATLTVVWIVTDPEVCHQRMLKRNSDRDTWKLANWEEYILSLIHISFQVRCEKAQGWCGEVAGLFKLSLIHI